VNEDKSSIIHEFHHYWIATTIAHKERCGQFGDNNNLLGATSAEVNKVFFQLAVKDAQELALEL
jgi:hypothetical protein